MDLIYNVKKKGTIWEAYPEFTRRKLFRDLPRTMEQFEDDYVGFGIGDLDKLIKFAIVFIDPSSPLADERDYDLRIVATMEYLGYSKKDRFYKEIDEDTYYWHLIMFEYFKMCTHLEYELWFSTWYGLKIQYAKLRNNKSMKETDRAKLIASLQDQTNDFIKLSNQLFPDERTKAVVARISTEDSVAGFAEKFALNLDE